MKLLVFKLILILEVLILACSSDKSSRKAEIASSNKDIDKPLSKQYQETVTNSNSNEAQLLTHGEIFNQIRLSDDCISSFSKISDYSTDLTIINILERNPKYIDNNLVKNLNDLDLTCFPTLDINFESCPPFEFFVKLQDNTIKFSKTSLEGIDSYVFSVYCTNELNGTKSNLREETNDGSFGPAGVQLSFSSELDRLYLGISEQNSGSTKLYRIDIEHCDINKISNYNSLGFYVIKSGPYKDYVITEDYSWAGYGKYEILNQDGKVENNIGLFSVYDSLSSESAALKSGSIMMPGNQPDTCYYSIRKNDTFDGLAEYYFGTSKESDELKKLNPGVDPRNLRIGQKLRVPCNSIAF